MVEYLITMGFHPVVVTTIAMVFSFGWPIAATWSLVKVWEWFDR